MNVYNTILNIIIYIQNYAPRYNSYICPCDVIILICTRNLATL